MCSERIAFCGKTGHFYHFLCCHRGFKILGVNRNIISKDEIGGITLCIKRNYYEEFMKNIYNKNYVDSEL